MSTIHEQVVERKMLLSHIRQVKSELTAVTKALHLFLNLFKKYNQ